MILASKLTGMRYSTGSKFMNINRMVAVPVAAFLTLVVGFVSQPASAQDQALAASSVLVSI